MGSTVRALALLAIAIAPSAWLAWNWRAMPQLGLYHDDGLYWVSAKALAQGGEYRIASLPQQPWQTKYPPLFPAILAMVWKANPSFPSNMPLATFAVWLAFPAYVVLIRASMLRFGFGRAEASALAFLAAVNPYAAGLAMLLLPEILFMTLLLACMLTAEHALKPHSRLWFAALAGFLGGLAYLTKSAALPILLTAPLCFLLKNQYRRALLFAAAMFPAIAGWQAWVFAHTSASRDLVTLYYTNYIGLYLNNISFYDLPRVIWYNLDSFLQGAGSLLTFDVALGGSRHMERVIAVAAIAGAVRLSLRCRNLQLPLASLAMAGVLLTWHYPPEPRLLFPLYPVLLAGLWTEMRNLWCVIARSWGKPAMGERTAAGVAAAVVATFGGFVCWTHVYGDFVFVPQAFSAYTAVLRSARPAYAWVEANTQPDSTFYAYDDPLMYLYTGRRACSLPVPTKLIYHDDDAGIDQFLRGLPTFSREQHLRYLLLSSNDAYRDQNKNGLRISRQAIAENPLFERVFAQSGVELYRRSGP